MENQKTWSSLHKILRKFTSKKVLEIQQILFFEDTKLDRHHISKWAKKTGIEPILNSFEVKSRLISLLKSNVIKWAHFALIYSE